MLVKNVISRAIKHGMIPEQTARGIIIFNPVTGLKVSAHVHDEHTTGRWRIHSSIPDRPEYDEFISTYVDNLKVALRLISTVKQRSKHKQ